MNISNFTQKSYINKGTFSKVYLVNDNNNNEYAMKVIKKNKKYLNQKNVFLEIDILKHCDSEYVPKLQFHYDDVNYIYIIMEYLDCYDLYDLLLKQEYKSFNISKTKYISACILLGLAYLHSQGIIHRDMKLENILIDKQGHIKIIDYNLSNYCPNNVEEKTIKTSYSEKMVVVKQPTTILQGCVGTIEYVSPEMIADNLYDYMVDWWAFGIIIYELLFGVTPFNPNLNDDDETIVNNILDYKFHVSYILPDTEMISLTGKNIIKKLLKYNVEDRLGYIGGSEEIKDHPFYLCLNFNTLYDNPKILFQ